MSGTGELKTSDEIINELLQSLNLPASPLKVTENIDPIDKGTSSHTGNNSPDIDYETIEPKDASSKNKKSKHVKKNKKKHKDGKSKHKKKKHDWEENLTKIDSKDEPKNDKSEDLPADEIYYFQKEKKTGKYERSQSREKYGSHSKVCWSRSRSNSQSRSRSRRQHKQKYSRTRSKSITRQDSQAKRKHYKSDSSIGTPSPRDIKRKQRKRSYSHSKSPSPRLPQKKPRLLATITTGAETFLDPLDTWRNAKLANLRKKILSSDVIEEGGNITFHLGSSVQEAKDEVVIDSIPLPVFSNQILTDPDKIPLPNVASSTSEATVDLNTIPIPEQEVNKSEETKSDQALPKKVDDLSKTNGKMKEEGKGKVIVIKNLKDSLVYQLAIEEAHKKSLEETSSVLDIVTPNYQSEINEGIKSEAEQNHDIAELQRIKLHNTTTESMSLGLANSTHLTTEIGQEEKTELNGTVSKEEGEIVSGDELENKPKISRKKEKKHRKDKKNRDRSKDHHSHKSRSKQSRSRSRDNYSPRRHSRSESQHHKRHQHRSRSHSYSHSPISHQKKNHDTFKSRSRSRCSESRRSNSHRSERSRSKSKPYKSKKSPDCVDKLRDKATRKRLLEVARKNAVYLMKNVCLPPGIERENIKVTGKSVEELTNFCKKLVTKGEYTDEELSDPLLSPDEADQPFAARHPFMVKDKPILMNIRNAPMLPTKTNAERLADTSKLREQFPVSSGSQHRTKESGWVPVQKEEKKEDDKVFPEEKQELDISHLVSTRLSAMRKLQDNPQDKDAIVALSSAQKEMQDWALSKQAPGQFTGTTGARIMSIEELSSGHQAWARKG